MPAPDEVLKRSLADRAPGKRDTRSFADCWRRSAVTPITGSRSGTIFCRNEYKGTGYIDGGRKQITGWLYQSLLDNKPYDQFVRELINPTAESEGFAKGIRWRGQVNASQVVEMQFAQNVGQVFFGANLKCASCHDSFIDNWKLDDAYGMAAVIADKPMAEYRCDKPTGRTAGPKFLFPELGTIDPKQPKAKRLERLAELVTQPGERPLHANDRQSHLASPHGPRHRASGRSHGRQAVVGGLARLPGTFISATTATTSRS